MSVRVISNAMHAMSVYNNIVDIRPGFRDTTDIIHGIMNIQAKTSCFCLSNLVVLLYFPVSFFMAFVILHIDSS